MQHHDLNPEAFEPEQDRKPIGNTPPLPGSYGDEPRGIFNEASAAAMPPDGPVQDEQALHTLLDESSGESYRLKDAQRRRQANGGDEPKKSETNLSPHRLEYTFEQDTVLWAKCYVFRPPTAPVFDRRLYVISCVPVPFAYVVDSLHCALQFSMQSSAIVAICNKLFAVHLTFFANPPLKTIADHFLPPRHEVCALRVID